MITKWRWRYVRGGYVVHALSAFDGMSRCGVNTSRWLGDRTQAQRDRAAAMPHCGRCERFIKIGEAS